MADLQATTINGTLTALRQENTTTASKILSLDDRDRVVACTNSNAITITVPSDSVAFPVGSVVYIARIGTGSVTLAGAGDVTLNKTGDLAEGEELYVRKRSSNNWVVVDAPYTPDVAGGTTSESNGIGTQSFLSTGASTLTIG